MTNAADNPGRRVLVVDDSKFVRTTFNRILSASFAVVEASDGDSAWQIIQSDASIAMVFSDLDMPKLDGFGLLRLIRGATDERVRKLPVVVISGSQNQSARDRAAQAGANDFISKSADAPEVLARIGHLLQAQGVQPAPQPAPQATHTTADPSATQHIATLKAAAPIAAPRHDPLTGILTPQNLLAEGRKHFALIQRDGGELSAMAFRLESYAQIARDAGKELADQLLARIAKTICAMLRSEDVFGRVGEASFMVLSAGSGATQMLAFARRLHAQLAGAQVRHGQQVLKIRSSFGVASVRGAAGGAVEDLMKLALQRVQLAAAHPDDPIVGGEPVPAAAAAAAPPREPASDIQRALELLERAGPEASEEIVRRLLPVLSAAFAQMQLRFPMDEVLKALENGGSEQLAA